MTRKANQTPRDPNADGTEIVFLPHEWRQYHRYSGHELGGYQRHVHRIMDRTDPRTLKCVLEPVLLERTIRYCRKYGGGGPNKLLRDTCIPALRRAGIDPLPEWAAP